MKFETSESSDALSARAAAILLTAIHVDPHLVLGLPTGRTPLGMYERVVESCGREYHCFRDVTTFNLDEYAGLGPANPHSYHAYMQEHLFRHVDIDPSRAQLPDGTAIDLAAECARYERLISASGGLGLTFLGLGTNGHIGFNEPGTPFTSRTRVVELSEATRAANASLFQDEPVPARAITMGIATILESRQIVLLVTGEKKRAAVERLRSGTVDESFPASALWNHQDVLVLVA